MIHKVTNKPLVTGQYDGATAQAEGRIRLAVKRLAGDYRFHAKVLERFVVRFRPSVKTMGVTASGDAVLLYHNPAFVLAISMDELVGVLLHEVHHVVFGHIMMNPAEWPDQWARIVAQEVTVNEFIVIEPLPGTPVLLSQFPSLPPMESTQARYNRLRKHSSRPPLFGPCGVVVVSSGSQGTGAGGGNGSVLDDHSVWQEAIAEGERAAAALRAAVHDAAIDVGADGVPDYLQAALARMGIGRLAGNGRYDLTGNAGGSLPWARLLRRYAGQCLAPRYDFQRPPRRCPELAGIVPGKSRAASRPRVLSVIDTSGSITPDLLEQISAELAGLAADFTVTVVECDAAVHAVYPYKPLKSVAGRGGTDLRPPFEPAFLRRHRPDLLIYFTDGFGPAPERPTSIPVIWCLTATGKPPAAWGRVIYMKGAL